MLRLLLSTILLTIYLAKSAGGAPVVPSFSTLPLTPFAVFGLVDGHVLLHESDTEKVHYTIIRVKDHFHARDNFY